MSATRDQSQKVAFVYSNLYQIYQKGKAEAIAVDVPFSSNSGAVIKAEEVAAQSAGLLPVESVAPVAVNPRSHILKTDDLRNQSPSSSVKVAEYNPTAFIGKRVARPAVLPPALQSTAAITSLKENLKSLNDLHSRLRFMLQELEELVKK